MNDKYIIYNKINKLHTTYYLLGMKLNTLYILYNSIKKNQKNN